MKILIGTAGCDLDSTATVLRPLRKEIKPDDLPISSRIIESQGPAHEELKVCLESLGHTGHQFHIARIAMNHWCPVRLSSMHNTIHPHKEF